MLSSVFSVTTQVCFVVYPGALRNLCLVNGTERHQPFSRSESLVIHFDPRGSNGTKEAPYLLGSKVRRSFHVQAVWPLSSGLPYEHTVGRSRAHREVRRKQGEVEKLKVTSRYQIYSFPMSNNESDHIVISDHLYLTPGMVKMWTRLSEEEK